MAAELRNYISHDETVIWNGAPDRKCFILESIFNPMLFFALLWGTIDLTFIAGMINSMMPDPEADVAAPGIGTFFPIIFFFGIHLMPVWIYLGGIIAAIVNHKNYSYAFTDKAVYIAKGGITENMTRIGYREIEHIEFRRGVFDKLLGVGDIVFITRRSTFATYGRRKRPAPPMFADIADFENVYRRIVAELQEEKFGSNIDESDRMW